MSSEALGVTGRLNWRPCSFVPYGASRTVAPAAFGRSANQLRLVTVASSKESLNSTLKACGDTATAATALQATALKRNRGERRHMLLAPIRRQVIPHTRCGLGK